MEELDYPFHDWTAVITTCACICYQSRKINVTQVFARQNPFGPKLLPMFRE